MPYGDFKDVERRTTSAKVLRDKAFNIAKNRKYDGYQRGLASIVYKFTKPLCLQINLRLAVVLICIQIINLNKINVRYSWLRIN